MGGTRRGVSDIANLDGAGGGGADFMMGSRLRLVAVDIPGLHGESCDKSSF
jgi:hypothetical protein